MNIPDNLFYTKDHEWVRIDGKTAYVGITDYAAHALGDITFVQLPKINEALKQSSHCATVESVKAASDVYAPLSGKVLAVNTKLETNPELINQSAYEQGYFFSLEISNLAEKANLMDTFSYQKYIEGISKMSYIPHTPEDIEQMLSAIGVKNISELFKDIPAALRPKSFNLPAAQSEFAVTQHLQNLSAKNATGLINFVGAGFYDHFIPAAVDSLSSRSEFYTAYTPYQPECSQGWLQAIYEYQSFICQLTGLDVSNASLYDGGTALFEGAMMALRQTGRNKIILDSGVNLIYRTMLYTYTSNLSIEFVEIPVEHGQSSREELFKHLDGKTAAVIFQNPNFFGAVDDYSDAVERVHKVGALAIASVYPVALGMLKTPAEMGFDIATGEGQSLGIPLSFGGPYLGFMAVKNQFVRQMPGRIVGATVDSDGKRGFVLTLQTREQHIRREKATSNICSNEALCALRAAIFVALLGRGGFKELAEQNFQKAEYAKERLSRIKGVQVKRSSPTFNEFTVLLPRKADEVVQLMIEKGYACGFPLGRFYKGMDNYLLIAVTEKRTKKEIDQFAECLEAIL